MKSKKNERFIYDHDVPVGYYDKVYRIKKGIQSKWHNQKFDFVKKKNEELKESFRFCLL